MSELSVVCCVSKPDVYDECLLSSVYDTKGDRDIDVIPIINHNNLYSASLALNLGLSASKTDVVVLAHQDVRLKDGWFDKLESVINDLPDDWGILGSAGISLDYSRGDIGDWGGALNVDTVAVGTVYDSDEAEDPYWDGIKNITKVHCADECLLVLNKKTGLRFDAQFTGFHFYGVDLCLQARAAALGVYCCDLPITHYGKYSASFTGDDRYWVYLRFLHNKWRLRFPQLLGTHMHWADKELTSYISLGMESEGVEINLKAMGISKAKFQTDKNFI
jgi:GT2 family glycosyltransferase